MSDEATKRRSDEGVENGGNSEGAWGVAVLAAPGDRVAKVEGVISTLLRVGVVSSLSIVLAGTILSFIHHRDYFSSPPALERLTRPGATFPHTLRQVGDGVVAGRGQAIVMVGLLLLIATPVLRVAVSVLIFVYQHDRQFTVITLIVLVLLLASFLLGKAGG